MWESAPPTSTSPRSVRTSRAARVAQLGCGSSSGSSGSCSRRTASGGTYRGSVLQSECWRSRRSTRPIVIRPRRRRRVLVLSGALAVPALAIAIWQAASLWPAARPTAGFQPAHRLTLKATATRLEAELTIGEPTGSTQPLRLVAEGFPTGGTGSYALWLVGPDGSEMVRAFQPNGEGSCAIDAAAPAGHWTQVAITRGNQPPTPGHTVASGSL